MEYDDQDFQLLCNRSMSLLNQSYYSISSCSKVEHPSKGWPRKSVFFDIYDRCETLAITNCSENPECQITSISLNILMDTLEHKQSRAYETSPCLNDEKLIRYLNQANVCQALTSSCEYS